MGSPVPLSQVIRSTSGNLIPIAGQARHLSLEWSPAKGKTSFVVIAGLVGTPVLLGIDIMVPLRGKIPTATCTAIPRLLKAPSKPTPPTLQPVPNSSSYPDSSKTYNAFGMTRAALLQTINIPAESVRFVRLTNPWLEADVCFEPVTYLPRCILRAPIVASSPTIWIALHNHRPEPVTLHLGHCIGTIEVMAIILPHWYCFHCTRQAPDRTNTLNPAPTAAT